MSISNVVNAANGYGALDRAGYPVLTGDWVLTPRPVVPVAEAGPDVDEQPAGDLSTDRPVIEAKTTIKEPVTLAPPEKVVSLVSPDEVEAPTSRPSSDDFVARQTPPIADELLDAKAGVGTLVSPPVANGPAPKQPATAVHPSRTRADDLLLNLMMTEGIESVRLRDPRFRWLVHQLPPSAALAPLLTDALESVVTFPVVPERTIDLLEQLVDYVGWLSGLTLEAELQSIVAPLAKDTMTPAILARLGWEGSAPVTLQDASEIANVTRERVRQVQIRVEQVLGEGRVWAPVLDRVLSALVAVSPTRMDRATDNLHRLGLTTSPAFSVEGILEAQRILGRTTGLRLIERTGFSVLSSGADGADEVIGELEEIRLATQKRVNNQGIAMLEDIRQHLAEQGSEIAVDTIADTIGLGTDYRLIAGDHVVPESWDSRNPLWNRLAKMLCLAPGLSPEMAAWQLGRDERWGYPVTPRTIRIFVEAHPDLELRGDGIFPAEPIADELVLSESERTLVALFREHGPELSFTELVPLAVGPTFTRITLAVRLASSPVIIRLARNRYRLLSALDRPEPGVASGEDVDLDAVIATGSLAEENGAATGTTETLDAPVESHSSSADVAGDGDEPEPGESTPGDRPVLVMAPGTELSIRLPDPHVAPIHQVVADLFAARLRWPVETRRQRWSASRLPDLLEAVFHGLPLGPLVIQRQVEPGSDGAAPVDPAALVVVDGQQRLAWLARLFNPSYRVPGQPQLAPVRVAFQPDLARFTLAGPESAADPFLIADIGPLFRADVSPWRITSDYLKRLRTVRTVDDATADRLAAAISAVAALRDAHLTIQSIDERLHPDAITHLYDRLHRG